MIIRNHLELAAIAILFLTGCSIETKPPKIDLAVEESSNLGRFLSSDPVLDARKAIQEGDLQFLAIRGYTVIVPGVPDFRDRLAGEYGYRVIEGTSDIVSSSAERKLQLGVRDYAEQYNRALLMHIGE